MCIVKLSQYHGLPWACRYEFLEELWVRRKGKKPQSSIAFALREQKLDPFGRKTQSSKSLLLETTATSEHADDIPIQIDMWPQP